MYGNDVETGNDKVGAGFRVPGFQVFCLGEIGQLARGLYCVFYIK